VWLQGLWTVIGKYNISSKLIENIKSLYKRAESAVFCGGTLSTKFRTSIGLRQFCPLSPTLFNLFQEQILTDAMYDFDGKVSIGLRKLCNLRFADDIDLITGSVEDLSRIDHTP